MKWIVVFSSLVFISATASAKTVSDFLREHPSLSKIPVVKLAIQEGASADAIMAASSDGIPPEELSAKADEMLRENGYEHAKTALRELATVNCSERQYAEISGFREKDCQVIKQVDSEIE
ncbi:hypothetical protein [Dickeya solani]|uniref:Uncharacterized protein n=1 Tax=Dickeya solani TaxID=1089444 RepID=A0ABU4EH26_9GAMM|nr:hypothetical protein [Dickeya solani]MCA6999481.1 hypothetical protein [Dickeya solani]MCZ0823821.1 hypothetical protein [Dickeya solani]MDV6996211.1 hypothetical protein [Dickeya solani]MDV7005394.1 hypothetical protein [Dickeya solani]MDV7037566.1 hypothetical protein [Dickeya solani]